jgi:hypothetical protein
MIGNDGKCRGLCCFSKNLKNLGKGLGFAKWVALVMTILLCGVFGWRSTASWQAVADGQPKAFAASLITLMLLGSLATVVKLLRR